MKKITDRSNIFLESNTKFCVAFAEFQTFKNTFTVTLTSAKTRKNNLVHISTL